MELMAHNGADLSIELTQLSTFRKNPNNSRVHNAKQIANLARSIKRFGFLTPVIIDDANMLLCGHARVEAAAQIGMTSVPSVRVEHLSEPEKRAFVIADNRLAECASWDEEILKKELRFLSKIEVDFDFSTIGFETADVDLLLDAPESANNDDDKLPELSADQIPVSIQGDLWILERNRVYCGNALDRESYETLLQSDRAQMVFTDPPYNVPIDGHVGGLGAIKHREFAMASGEMTDQEYTQFLVRAARQMADFTADGSLHFISMDWRHTEMILAAGNQIYSELKNICVWNKTNSGMGSLYRSKHEFIFLFKNGRGPHINNIELGKHGRNRTNVWDYAGANCFGKERDTLLALHPTVKPTALVADAIKDCSKRGDLILDPFAGSGTTVIAAEKVGRRAAVMEIDPIYVDAIVLRWQLFTGKQAICSKTGMTFAEREAKQNCSAGRVSDMSQVPSRPETM